MTPESGKPEVIPAPLEPTEQALQNLREHLKDVKELSSTRFRAFADCVDEAGVYLVFSDTQEFSSHALKLGLIQETIRQRENEIPGYKNEYQIASRLKDRLLVAKFNEDPRPQSTYKIETANELLDIKDETIDAINNQTSTIK